MLDNNGDFDAVIDLYKRDIDRTLLRRNLLKTPQQRSETLIALQRFADELRAAGERVRAEECGGR